MKITCISDLHGAKPELPGGDLLIVAGDLTACDTVSQWVRFFEWFKKQDYCKKVYIGGNHDNFLAQCISSEEYAELFDCYPDGDLEFADYLKDSGTEFQGLKIWGSPWTQSFSGMNPHCMAFTEDRESLLEQHFAKIPDDTDILITHSPPFKILDEVETEFNANFGSISLLTHTRRVNPKLHVFGHIHENGGKKKKIGKTLYVNAAYMSPMYIEGENKIITVEL